MWYVYVLVCEDASLYTGISTDPEKRLQKHLSGTGSKYMRLHKPIKILYREPCTSKSAALKRELEIKRWDRQTKITRLRLSL